MRDYGFRCVIGGELVTIKANEADVKAWQSGTLIQDALPYLTAAERELFITSICGKCFEELFAEDED